MKYNLVPKGFATPIGNFVTKVLPNLLLNFSRMGFIERCEHWREREGTVDILFEDVYDGKVWRDFQIVNGRDFLSRPHCFGLMMNIDWFQPFKHTNYSVGAIYIYGHNESSSC